MISFEPNPNTVKLLRKNVATNGFANVSIFENAVADQDGRDIFYPVGPHSSFGYDRFHGSAGKGVEVGSVRIDDVVRGRVDFIKMDIEGSEWKAVKGMRRILTSNKDIKLLTEFCPELLKMSGGDLRSFLSELNNLGFKLYDVNREDSRVMDIDYFISTYDKPTIDGKISVTNILCTR